MIPQLLIGKKRDGAALTGDEIAAFVGGLTDGRVTEGQAAAFCMAVYFRGLDARECADLTAAMAHSGQVIDWRSENLPGPILDKHSTGGVGDAASLILAPVVACCGGFVPMIAGRGLGHTGGTIDKLESIPGYNTRPDMELFRKVVRETGCAIIGQTDEIAPADRVLYAIRDVTATVDSIGLITASILSKKLAAGIERLVMDVKVGSGGFMGDLSAARKLARSLCETGAAAGLPVAALLTDMSQPLASAAGNALEIDCAIDCLTGARRERRLIEATLTLAAEMLTGAGLFRTRRAAAEAASRSLTSGAAAERFARMTRALGGPADILERKHNHSPRAKAVRDVFPRRAGYVARIDARALGMAVVALGGGRTRRQDKIDPSVGFSDIAQIGDRVGPDAPIARAHAHSMADARLAAETLESAFAIEEKPRSAPDLIIERRKTNGESAR